MNFYRDLIELIMNAVDDPPTYCAFAKCNRLTASIARRQLVAKQIQWRRVRPIIYCKRAPEFFTPPNHDPEIALSIGRVTDYRVGGQIVERGIYEIMSGEEAEIFQGGYLSRMGDLVQITANCNIRAEFSHFGVDFILEHDSNILVLPLYIFVYNSVCIHHPCKLRYFYLSKNLQMIPCSSCFIPCHGGYLKCDALRVTFIFREDVEKHYSVPCHWEVGSFVDGVQRLIALGILENKSF